MLVHGFTANERMRGKNKRRASKLIEQVVLEEEKIKNKMWSGEFNWTKRERKNFCEVKKEIVRLPFSLCACIDDERLNSGDYRLKFNLFQLCAVHAFHRSISRLKPIIYLSELCMQNGNWVVHKMFMQNQ